MPLTRAALQQALDNYARWLHELEALHGASAERMAILMDDYAKAITNIVAQGSFPEGAAIQSEAQLRAIMTRIEAETARLMGDVGTEAQTAIRQSTAALETQMLDVYGILGRSTVGRLTAAAANFEARTMQQIGTAGYRNWLTTFQGEGQKLIGILEREMVRSQILDQGQEALARAIARHPEFTWSNLPPVSERGMAVFTRGGKLGDAEALQNRARLIARTELAGISNQMHVSWAQEAGLTYFVNINPMDDRTTEGCAEASAEPAKTMDEWSGWSALDGQSGPAPRRWNCRSTMFAVPDELRQHTGLPTGSAQILEEVGIP